MYRIKKIRSGGNPYQKPRILIAVDGKYSTREAYDKWWAYHVERYRPPREPGKTNTIIGYVLRDGEYVEDRRWPEED